MLLTVLQVVAAVAAMLLARAAFKPVFFRTSRSASVEALAEMP